MTRTRLLPAVMLAAGLFVVVSGAAAPLTGSQPPQPRPGGQPVREAVVPLVPKSAAAFVTIRVSELVAHPNLKPVLAELAKQPDALAGITELIGVSPLELDRVTLFWSRFGPDGGSEPVLVVTTREPFNEARVLKALGADPVFDRGFRRGRGHTGGRWGVGAGAKPAMKADTGPALNSSPKSSVKELSEPKPADDPPSPKGLGPKNPAPPLRPEQDDLCGGSSDGGPADPLFYALDCGPFQALFLIDDRTLVFLPGGSDGDFATLALLAATMKKNATGPLADAISAAGTQTFAAGVYLTPLFREFDRERRVPAEMVPYTALFAARTAVLVGGADATAKFDLTLTFDGAAAARRAAPVLEEGISTVAERIAGLADNLKESHRLADRAAAPLITAVVAGLKKAAVKVEGTAVTARAEIDAGPVAVKALSAWLQAMHSRKKAEARMDNLKEIGLALHSYHDANGKFPTNVYGPKGEPLLSWRIQLLPYLGAGDLYRQFKMNEPWDGENNKKLIEKMPKNFLAPDREAAKGKTYYLAFSASGPRNAPPPRGIFGRPWLMDGDAEGLRITSIADGTSNTVAVIEARDGVIWSKPEDLPFGGPVPALGEKGWDRTPALRFDGSTVLFPTNLKADEFWPFITINGGEVTPDLDDDTPFNRTRPGRPPVGESPANPVKEPGVAEQRPREVRELEQRVAELTEELQVAEARTLAAEAAAKAATTAEEFAKATALVDETRKFAQVRKDQLQQARERLRAAQRSPATGHPEK